MRRSHVFVRRGHADHAHRPTREPTLPGPVGRIAFDTLHRLPDLCREPRRHGPRSAEPCGRPPFRAAFRIGRRTEAMLLFCGRVVRRQERTHLGSPTPTERVQHQLTGDAAGFRDSGTPHDAGRPASSSSTGVSRATASARSGACGLMDRTNIALTPFQHHPNEAVDFVSSIRATADGSRSPATAGMGSSRASS